MASQLLYSLRNVCGIAAVSNIAIKQTQVSMKSMVLFDLARTCALLKTKSATGV